MATLHNVLTGLVDIQNKVISKLIYNNNAVNSLSTSINVLSSSINNISIPEINIENLVESNFLIENYFNRNQTNERINFEINKLSGDLIDRINSSEQISIDTDNFIESGFLIENYYNKSQTDERINFVISNISGNLINIVNENINDVTEINDSLQEIYERIDSDLSDLSSQFSYQVDLSVLSSSIINVTNNNLNTVSSIIVNDINLISGQLNNLSGSLKDFNFNDDYTAFEVFAHDYAIPSGTINEDLGGYISYPIPSSLTHSMLIRTNGIDNTKSDVIIDWGDGTTSAIANGDYSNASISESDNETNYTVEHTYSNNGKYIIKIFGKGYFNIQGLSNSDANRFKYNLICRAFDEDLPIASHLLNFAGFLKNSNHLLKVHVPSYHLIRNAKNIAYLFMECHNLLSVKGLKNVFSNMYSANQVFSKCESLAELEYTLPSLTLVNSGLRDTFNGCKALSENINNLISDNVFIGSTYDVRWLFQNCSALSGIVPAEKLWNNINVTWINTSTCFKGCSNDIRSQVPVSWGGTASDDIISGNFVKSVNGQTGDVIIDIGNSIDKSDYTAFEVFAHDYDITKGTIVSELGGDHTPVGCDIPSSMIHKMRIRTGSLDTENSDIIIDWGDGTTSAIANGDFESTIIDTDAKETDYVCAHDYTNTGNGKYIIKVYGRKYYNICTPPDSNNLEPTYNLICRVFDYDLPIASNVTNIAGWCRYAIRLLSVHVPSYFGLTKYNNISNLFQGCKNLQVVKGMANQFLVVSAAGGMFAGCETLRNLEFTIPAAVTRTGLAKMFQNCFALSGNIQDFFPAGGFLGGTLNVQYLFHECKSLSGTVPADMLWNDTRIKFINYNTAFSCSPTYDNSIIRSQVPTTWGGTKAE